MLSALDAHTRSGPYPEIKFPTIISRMNKSPIQTSHLFFRTSATSRATPRFLRESSILPPGMYAASVESLQNVAGSLDTDQVLELHFADEEGDPYAVELAARLGGYVVGNDSDFLILNADGYRGYVPLSRMVWSSLDTEDDGTDGAEADGFQTVVSKGKKKAVATQSGVSRGIIPPDAASGLQLSVITYSPASLAAHLQLPISLLPLLGALVGNDFTGEKEASATTAKQTNLQWLFFERSLTLTQRITRVATTLRTILAAALAPGRGRAKHAVHSVMELIERAVSVLAVRAFDGLATGERERVVERIVDATLQYAIPRYDGALPGAAGLWPDGTCALHDAASCPLLRVLASRGAAPGGARAAQREEVRAAYVGAYRAGRLDPHTLDVLHSGTFWYRLFLENPDVESVACSVARPVQLWTYALLDDALGLPVRPQPEQEQEQDGAEAEDSDGDELVDVVEEESEEEDVDPLAPLRGALQQLNGSEGTLDGSTSDATAAAQSSMASRKAQPKIVEEYVRRGMRLAPEDVIVPPLSELLASLPDGDQLQLDGTPIQLRPPEERLTLLLKALHSDVPLVRSLPPTQRIPALVMRWVAHTLHDRAQARAHDRAREQERWTPAEARSFLASFAFSSPSVLPVPDDPSAPVPLADRSVQRTAQVLTALDSIARFAEVLLLRDALPSPVLRFSGRRFHAHLARGAPPAPDAVPDRLWRASVEGLGHAFAEPPGKKKKKKKREKREAPEQPPPQKGGKKGGGGVQVGGKFGLLADVDGEA